VALRIDSSVANAHSSNISPSSLQAARSACGPLLLGACHQFAFDTLGMESLRGNKPHFCRRQSIDSVSVSTQSAS
jgi:hypothetical protein